MLGALCHYVTHADPKRFQPMKANLGILPPFATRIKNKAERKRAYAERAKASMLASLRELRDDLITTQASLAQTETA